MLKVESTTLNILEMHTRFPFKYGIAALTAVPHLFVRVNMIIDGQPQQGIASEGLPPKWFTKNPKTHFRDDLSDMFHVIETACGFAEQVGEAKSVFDLWQNIYIEQMAFGVSQNYPSLLWSFGVSLVERAMIDAFCKSKNMPFAQAVSENWMGIKLGELNGELKRTQPTDWLNKKPLRKINMRHTVGLADALTNADIPHDECVADGLPQSLEACIEYYGLTHLKIKLSGNLDNDLPRLHAIATLLDNHETDFQFTVDGNEQYKTIDHFREHWQTITSDAKLQKMMTGLLFVEQPLHRDVALSSQAIDEMLSWDDRPGMIIDESDGSIASAADALESGYIGTSHKNCKGVFKGIGNACLIAKRLKEEPHANYVISGEDLANVGPVALLQDLAVMATLGINHVERNGHHYFKGLHMFSDKVQQAVITAHGDLYQMHQNNFATLKITQGQADLKSVINAPFGFNLNLDTEQYTPIDDWTYDMLEPCKGTNH